MFKGASLPVGLEPPLLSRETARQPQSKGTRFLPPVRQKSIWGVVLLDCTLVNKKGLVGNIRFGSSPAHGNNKIMKIGVMRGRKSQTA